MPGWMCIRYFIDYQQDTRIHASIAVGLDFGVMMSVCPADRPNHDFPDEMMHPKLLRVGPDVEFQSI